MAVAPVITLRNNGASQRFGFTPIADRTQAHFRLAFGATDTYVTGGFSILAELKRATGLSRIDEFAPFNGGSDAGVATGEVNAVYDHTNQVVKLYEIGRNNGSGVSVPDTEIANATSINAVTIDGVIVGY